MRRLYPLFSLFMALVIIASNPARGVAALDSVSRSCSATPESAAMCAELGLEASFSAAAATTSGSSIAAANAGATVAAPNIVFPAAVYGLAGGATGLAFYSLPWGETAADDFRASAAPEFEGGQCEVPYAASLTVKFQYSDGSDLPPRSVSAQFPGPWGEIIGELNGNSFDVSWPSATTALGTSGGTNSIGADILEATLTRVDGQPDDCGSLPPEFDPDRIPEFAPSTDSPSYFPQIDPNPNIAGDEYYDSTTYNPPNNDPYILINPTTGEPEWKVGLQTIPSPELGPDGQPNQNPNPTTDPDPDAQTSDPNLSGDYSPSPAIQPDTFSQPHFVTHALTVFADKFPLDILGTLPEGGTDACPTLTFWDNPYELCIIKTILDLVKAPILLGFLIWGFMEL